MDTSRREKERPKLRSVLLLKCPYCLAAPLRKKRSWLHFQSGCNNCHYGYRKEKGYFWSSTFMINFPIMIITALSSAVLLKHYQPQLDETHILIISVAIAGLFGLFITPFCKAFWLYLDHMFHPLSERENSNSLKL